jgi:hypothetical protein
MKHPLNDKFVSANHLIVAVVHSSECPDDQRC